MSGGGGAGPQTGGAPPPPTSSTAAAAAQVELHLYDISQGLARSFAPMLGLPVEAIWHSSVVVREGNSAEEIFFGYGVQRSPVGTTPFGRPLRVLPLGTTELDASTRASLLADLSERYRPQHYDLVKNNCNHFAHELAELLCGTGAPRHVVDQAETLLRSPLGRMLEPMLRQGIGGVTGRATATGFQGGGGGGFGGPPA